MTVTVYSNLVLIRVGVATMLVRTRIDVQYNLQCSRKASDRAHRTELVIQAESFGKLY